MARKIKGNGVASPDHGLFIHGCSNPPTPEYRAWRGMISRCSLSCADVHGNYKSKGIRVCDRWKESFVNFYDDMGPRPTPFHSIDRYPDPAGDYEPSNTRWGTIYEQARNRVKIPRYDYKGKNLTVAEWSEITGISGSTLRIRLKRWPIEEALGFKMRDKHPPLPNCRRGHPWTKENTYVKTNGDRQCLICLKASKKGKRENKGNENSTFRGK